MLEGGGEVEKDVIIRGEALAKLKELPDESVDMCITSPPYWGLRDYGHDGQVGLEPDFRDFVQNLADIFDEVRRVLKPEGSCWVNLGDSYMGGATGGDPNSTSKLEGGRKTQKKSWDRPSKKGLPSKSLVQIPARFGIEMADRGWILRNELIWHKPSVMPASVKDRFTVDFEKIFFFTKQPRYYFDQQFEPMTEDFKRRMLSDWNGETDRKLPGGQKHNNLSKYMGKTEDEAEEAYARGRNKRTVWTVAAEPFTGAHFAVYPPSLIKTPILAGCPEGGVVLDPFFGAGTTGLVAMKLGRHFIGIELNPEYADIAEARLAPLLNQTTIFDGAAA